MQERGWGRVVAITSLSVRQPIANLILSNTARAGVTGFLKTMARELAGNGVTVNSVQPGLHRTPRIVELYGAEPPGPVGDPGDFGAVVAFLCSEQAEFITGAAIHVDGGSVHRPPVDGSLAEAASGGRTRRSGPGPTTPSSAVAPRAT